jgi:hypothetical protein
LYSEIKDFITSRHDITIKTDAKRDRYVEPILIKLQHVEKHNVVFGVKYVFSIGIVMPVPWVRLTTDIYITLMWEIIK